MKILLDCGSNELAGQGVFFATFLFYLWLGKGIKECVAKKLIGVRCVSCCLIMHKIKFCFLEKDTPVVRLIQKQAWAVIYGWNVVIRFFLMYDMVYGFYICREETFNNFPSKLNPRTVVHNWWGSIWLDLSAH